jgi:hypothetical protein
MGGLQAHRGWPGCPAPKILNGVVLANDSPCMHAFVPLYSDTNDNEAIPFSGLYSVADVGYVTKQRTWSFHDHNIHPYVVMIITASPPATN